MARITDCIKCLDIEGEGETIDDALFDIAQKCSKDADDQELLARELRAAAERFLKMREVPK